MRKKSAEILKNSFELRVDKLLNAIAKGIAEERSSILNFSPKLIMRY